MEGSVWDRQRAAVRREIVVAATRLFIERGFEGTTMDDVAAQVGVSRRTIFRYFGTKEDLLLDDLFARGEAIAVELEARPLDESAWTALLEAMRAARHASIEDHKGNLAVGRMMREVPTLRARYLEKRQGWHALLVPPLADRINGPHADIAAAAIVSSALGCLDVATDAFLDLDGHVSLEEVFLTAVSAVRGRDVTLGGE